MPRKLKSGILAQGLIHNQSSKKDSEIWRFKSQKKDHQIWEVPPTQRLAEFKYQSSYNLYVVLNPLNMYKV